MDEKTTTTVEFLRARLLSERIVSRTARQRSEMLAQKVMELEEQLRIVNIQRKKAEKAAEGVLSILETQGITCLGGLTDSSTDQEDNQHTEQEGNNCILSKDIKEDEFLAPSRLDESKIYDGPSLSWKSHGSSPDSQQKQKTKTNRHRQNNNFIITKKSSQRFPGKSCRKIKRHNASSTSENESAKSLLLDAHGNGAVTHPDEFDENHECRLEASESKIKRFSVDSSFCFDNGSRGSKVFCGKDDGMERALEQQSQLIVQFQAMEEAQRDWEEKFSETKMPMLENPEPDKAENEEEASSVKDISFVENKKNERCRNCEMADGRAACESTAINVIETVPEPFTSQPQESPDLTRKAHLRPNLEKPNAGPVRKKEVHPHDKKLREEQYPAMSINEDKHAKHDVRVLHTPLVEQLTPVTNEKISNSELFKEMPRQQSPATSSSLGSVLESLHRARISLRQELVKMPSSGQVKPALSCKALDFPTSMLFRLPSDSIPRAQFSGTNLYGSGLRLTATRPDLEYTTSTVSPIQSPYTSPYPRPGSNHVDPYPFSPYKDGTRVEVHEEYANCYPTRGAESESRVSATRDYFDGRPRTSMSASSANEYPFYYPGLTTRGLSMHDEVLNSSPGLRSRTPFGNRSPYGGSSCFSSLN